MTRVLRFRAMGALHLAVLLFCALPAFAQMEGAAMLQDLQADGALARQMRLPILVIVEQADCHYCVTLDREVIRPLIASGQYENKKVILRRLDLTSELPIRDFDGQPVMPAEFAYRYKAYVTPTLLFLGPDGRELADKLVGLGTLDFYWTYLDQAIDTALAGLQPCGPDQGRSVAQKGAAGDAGVC